MRFAVSVVRYDNDKIPLVRDCMLPIAIELAEWPGVERSYLERHWLLGPRVRLCVRAREDAVRERVRTEVVPRLQAHVERFPSRATLDEVAYLRLSESLGVRELVKPPYGPLSPDNSCLLEAHGPRIDLLGSDAAVDFYEEFLTRAMAPLAAHLEAARTDRNARLDYAIRILAVLAASYHGGVVAGSLSYRSHLEHFLHESDADGRIAKRFAAHYQANREAIVKAVRSTLDDMEDGLYKGDDPILAGWGGLFEFGRTRGLELAEKHVITEDPGPLFRPVAEQIGDEALKPWTDYEGRTWSGFHATMRSATLAERVNVEIFSAYRWMVNMQYALLKLLDVSPMERYFLNHLLSEAIQEVSGVTWKEHLDKVYRSYGLEIE